MTTRRVPHTPGAYTLLIAALIDRRHHLGYSQRALAPMLHLGQSAIAQYESGCHVPSAARLVLWADALDCDLVLIPREAE